MPDATPARPKRNPRRVLIVVGGLFLAVNVIVIAGISQRTNKPPVLPNTIEELIPQPDDIVSPNSTFGVNLRDDLQGVLAFDGAEIPDDQVEKQVTEGIYQYTPGPGKDLAQLPQGFHTITVRYWPRGDPASSTGTTEYTWRIKVGA